MLFVVNELVSDSNRGFEVFLFFIRKGLKRMKTNEAIEILHIVPGPGA